jgi:hypothetical protein
MDRSTCNSSHRTGSGNGPRSRAWATRNALLAARRAEGAAGGVGVVSRVRRRALRERCVGRGGGPAAREPRRAALGREVIFKTGWCRHSPASLRLLVDHRLWQKPRTRRRTGPPERAVRTLRRRSPRSGYRLLGCLTRLTPRLHFRKISCVIPVKAARCAASRSFLPRLAFERAAPGTTHCVAVPSERLGEHRAFFATTPPARDRPAPQTLMPCAAAKQDECGHPAGQCPSPATTTRRPRSGSQFGPRRADRARQRRRLTELRLVLRRLPELRRPRARPSRPGTATGSLFASSPRHRTPPAFPPAPCAGDAHTRPPPRRGRPNRRRPQ